MSVPTDRSAWVQIAKAAVASAAAWELARVTTDTAAPIFAPLAAMLTVQATVLESVRTGLQRTAGVATGVVLAFVLSSALGVHWWSVGILVFVGLLVGQTLNLGTQGSTQIAVSALLVLVLSGGGNSYAVARVSDTLIGAAVGIIISLVVAPPLHVRDSGRAICDLAKAQAAVLTAIAEALRSSWPGKGSGKRLEQARSLNAAVTRTGAEVDRGDASVRYNVRTLGTPPVVAQHRAALRRLEHAQIMILGIARTLFDEEEAQSREAREVQTVPTGPPLPDELRGQLITALLGAAKALRLSGETALDGQEPAAAEELRQQLQDARAAAAADARALLRSARSQDLPARLWLVLGSILTDLRRLVAELDARAEAAGLPRTPALRRTTAGFRRRRKPRSRSEGQRD
ncbi:MAG: hypothetical protein JWN96_3184 [Mycobacterium sp.]|nr:hypothetical protein [Mycobacterium sp.]